VLALKLSIRNLIGAGLRTWLTVFVLSLSFVVIIWHRGFIDGWNNQMRDDIVAWDAGGGQYWHPRYDPYDPLTLNECHGTIPQGFATDEIAPVLITQGMIYPDGRFQSVLIRGIEPQQSILHLPTMHLDTSIQEIPALIGTRMATSAKLKQGDVVTVRWRDARGAFDAAELKIVGLFSTTVQPVDIGQVWIPLNRLQTMMQLPGEATILVARQGNRSPRQFEDWRFQDLSVLLADLDEIIEKESIEGYVIYIILLLLAMLAIFDTQVLSIFRRQKEIGTYMALGMSRWQVIRLFTIEGGMHGILATGVAALYGIPILAWQAKQGFTMPEGMDAFGMSITKTIFPRFGLELIVMTIIIVLLATTIVSFLPARRIARMKPTEAIRGRIQ
jgi:ABC-type lipoprotein release transport system permease subunit